MQKINREIWQDDNDFLSADLLSIRLHRLDWGLVTDFLKEIVKRGTYFSNSSQFPVHHWYFKGEALSHARANSATNYEEQHPKTISPLNHPIDKQE